jgi:hypothetical protein
MGSAKRKTSTVRADTGASGLMNPNGANGASLRPRFGTMEAMRRMFLAFFLGVAGTSIAIPQGQPITQAPDLSGATKVGYGRVLPVGDALTVAAGGTASGGWRRILETNLQRKGIKFQYVGRRDSLSQMAMPFHEGHAGWTSNQIMDGRPGDSSGNLSQWMTTYHPDTVLLFTGVHDPDSHPSRYLGMLGTIFRINPQAKVVVGLLPAAPGDTEFQTRLNLKRQGQVAAVTAFKQMGYSVDLVDTVTGFDEATMLAGATPNEKGYQKIATSFQAGLKQVWGF